MDNVFDTTTVYDYIIGKQHKNLYFTLNLNIHPNLYTNLMHLKLVITIYKAKNSTSCYTWRKLP